MRLLGEAQHVKNGCVLRSGVGGRKVGSLGGGSDCGVRSVGGVLRGGTASVKGLTVPCFYGPSFFLPLQPSGVPHPLLPRHFSDGA